MHFQLVGCHTYVTGPSLTCLQQKPNSYAARTYTVREPEDSSKGHSSSTSVALLSPMSGRGGNPSLSLLLMLSAYSNGWKGSHVCSNSWFGIRDYSWQTFLLNKLQLASLILISGYFQHPPLYHCTQQYMKPSPDVVIDSAKPVLS